MRPRRWLGLIMLGLLLLLLLTGCWDNREPRRRAFVLGLAVDSAEDGSRLEVSLQLPVPYRVSGTGGRGGGGSGQGPQYFLVKGTGRTMTEALQHAQDRVSRDLFFGQMRAIVLSDQLSAHQMHLLVEGIRSETEIEETVYMAITHGRAERVLGYETILERLPALFLNNVFEAVRRSTVSVPVQYWEFWRAAETSGWEPILPLVTLTDENELQVRGLAVFRGLEYVGSLEGEEPQGFLWLTGRTRERALAVESEEGLLGTRSLSAARTVSLRFERGEPIFTVSLTITGEIAQVPPEWEGTDVLERANRLIEPEIRRQVEGAITRIQQELRADIFGFGKRVYYSYPDYFERVDWEKVFPEIQIETSINVELLRKGAKS